MQSQSLQSPPVGAGAAVKARRSFESVRPKQFSNPEEFLNFVERALREHRFSKGGAKRIMRFFEAYLHCRQEENAITERTYELLSNLLMRAISSRRRRSPDKVVREVKEGIAR
ncbi:MAG: hypothetical protein QXU54_00180 [Candidatus Micrarchaeia archaeon]